VEAVGHARRRLQVRLFRKLVLVLVMRLRERERPEVVQMEREEDKSGLIEITFVSSRPRNRLLFICPQPTHTPILTRITHEQTGENDTRSTHQNGRKETNTPPLSHQVFRAARPGGAALTRLHITAAPTSWLAALAR
jgi:hypothetical protein